MASRNEANATIERMGWSVGRLLGEGAFGKVFLVRRRSDGVEAACKIIVKPRDLKSLKTLHLEYKVGTLTPCCSATPHAPPPAPTVSSLAVRSS